MKYYGFLLIALSYLFIACDPEPVPPGIIITPNTYLQEVDPEDVIEFNIRSVAGDAALSKLEISTKPEGGVTTQLVEFEISGQESNDIYVFEVGENPVEDQLLVFTVTDVDGLRGQTARRILLNNDPVLVESSGHDLYSNWSSSNSNAFDIETLEQLFLASLADSSNVDLVHLDETDDEAIDNVITSLSGIRFVRNNSFNYASARQSTALNTFESSVPLQTISDLQIDDILITKYDTLDFKYAAIRIMDIQDEPGSENDRIVFNLKK